MSLFVRVTDGGPPFIYLFSYLFFLASGQAVVTGVVPSPPRFLPSIFIAHRVQHSRCSSIFHRVLLTHALALSASQFVHKKKSPRIYTSMHSWGFEFTKLTYTRLEDNLIHHRGDRSIKSASTVLKQSIRPPQRITKSRRTAVRPMGSSIVSRRQHYRRQHIISCNKTKNDACISSSIFVRAEGNAARRTPSLSMTHTNFSSIHFCSRRRNFRAEGTELEHDVDMNGFDDDVGFERIDKK